MHRLTLSIAFRPLALHRLSFLADVLIQSNTEVLT